MNLNVSELGSLGRRLLALVFDGIILFIPCVLANHIIPVVGSIVVWFFYAPILESSELKATLGKYLVGIQVVDPVGRRVSIRAATVRNVLKFVSCILLFIGFIFALFTKNKQTLHDILADTVVIYSRSELLIMDVWIRSIKELFNSNHSSLNEQSTILQLERLQSLRDRGTITEEEFQNEKRKILQSSS